MKKAILFGSALAVTILGMSFESVERVEAVHNRTAAPAKHTGSPGDGAICTACHTGSPVFEMPDIITTNIPAGGYVPGNTYTITLTLSNPGTTRFGFQLSPQNLNGDMLGAWGPSTTETQVVNVKWATHKLAGTSGTDGKVWNLEWTAPAAGTGEVTFYGAFNITNADNTTSGDMIWKSSLTVQENGNSSLANVSKLKLNSYVDGNSRLHISVEEAQSSSANIRLVDMNGKTVINWPAAELAEGQWSAALPEMSAGVYLVQVQAGALVGSRKIVVF